MGREFCFDICTTSKSSTTANQDRANKAESKHDWVSFAIPPNLSIYDAKLCEPVMAVPELIEIYMSNRQLACLVASRAQRPTFLGSVKASVRMNEKSHQAWAAAAATHNPFAWTFLFCFAHIFIVPSLFAPNNLWVYSAIVYKILNLAQNFNSLGMKNTRESLPIEGCVKHKPV